MAHIASYTMLTVTWCVQSVVPSGLDLEGTGGSIVCYCLSASRVLSRCNHDIGTLSWLNAKTFERVPTPLFDRLVRCSALGRSFATLWLYSFRCG